MGGEKELGTLFAYAQFFKDFWEFRNFNKIYSVTLTTNLHEACRLLLGERCLSLTTLCVDIDKGVTKTLSSLLAEIVIHSS